MALGHERLDVYRLAIRYVAWVYEKAVALEGVHRMELDRMAAMLSRRGGRGYQVRESGEAYTAGGAEVDPDPDSDSNEIKPQRQRWRHRDTVASPLMLGAGGSRGGPVGVCASGGESAETPRIASGR
jgi:hypothetical protein